MDNRDSIPLTEAELETVNRKVDLVLSMVGKDHDTALTILSYAITHVAINAGVTVTSLISNLCDIIDKHYYEDEDDNDNEEY